MIVWILVILLTDGKLHRSAPYYDEHACLREVATVMQSWIPNQTFGSPVGIKTAYCEQVKAHP